VGFQGSDEIESSILVECGLTVTQGSYTTSDQGNKTSFGLVFGSASTSNLPTLDTLLQDSFLLKGDFRTVARPG